MALINDIYIHVTDESLSEDVEASSHPVESGINITDTIKVGAATLSISGMIVEYPTGRMVRDSTKWSWDNEATLIPEIISASTVISKLNKLKKTGGMIRYIGRNWLDKMQITSFETSHPNTVWGGCEFSMTLKECRIAHNAYVAPKVVESTGTSSVKNGGEQKVKEESENIRVEHITKKGDTVWELVVEHKLAGKMVDGPYKKYDRPGAKAGPQGACDWVMEHNKTAFSRYGDFTTLQIGKRLLVGYKKGKKTTPTGLKSLKKRG
jgi:hypothetical protein